MKLLVGFDGSNVAKDALKLALSKAEKYGGEIEIVKSLLQSHTLKYEEIRSEEQELEKEVKEIWGSSKVEFKTHVIVTQMTSGEALVDFAKEHKAEEVIIGIKRRSKVSKLVFGSTAQHIILNAPCPVLTIR